MNYVSPEQIAGHVVDARADMFGGRGLHELLSYRRAFAGDLESDVLTIAAGGRSRRDDPAGPRCPPDRARQPMPGESDASLP